MNVISGATTLLSTELLSKMSSYRHKVFVETLEWKLESKNGAELDQFDRPDTVYVVARDELGNVNGCARLLPTTAPYLLGEIFPQLMNGLPPPNTSDVWELSRFAAMDFNNQTTSALKQFSSPIAVQLLQESIICAAALGAKRLITVSPIGIERLLRRAGFHAHRGGPPMIIDGHPIFACWIEV
ncbi:acyl-homoserine-lactone synthase [Glaciimonas immobilis]|uniref:Acyl-homoserine-lactone synthase n=1 Tax=Glaciimonas immobilis TaxID=728004 RepID=A0A840RXQ1_9BURK|nr:acyl-homoserine-lactone synthase [Glaciimonas immobilis]KAF3996240.1 GNAT family N-acetyltransferase [Glaciimonas immobilis]MBB5202353.1 N-acyl-L-homoserine lactone synthetase [Glaciimonas immobilis]